MGNPAPRFLLLLGLLVLALCAAYAALVLRSATWAEARALDLIFPFYGTPIRAFTPAEMANARNGLGVAALLLAAAGAGMTFSAAARRELAAAGQEIRQAAADLWGEVSTLGRAHRLPALAMLGFLTVLRLYFSVFNPEYDDAVSYEVFVSKGLLATSAYYPIPNNHVFSNTISLLFYQLSPGFWWSMRLPVLLISTAATVFLFAGLRRLAGFRVAAVATGLFGSLQLSLYHAGVGRGYWLVIFLAGVVFFSTLKLAEGRSRQRAAWAGLVLAGALGCYTVPPFVYVLASGFSWLGLAFVARRQWARLLHLAGAGALIGLAAVTLYAPLLFVSGLNKLVGNGYVSALQPEVFWPGLPRYLWFNEGFLAGQRTLGAFLTMPVLALVGRLFYLSRQGRLPTDQAHRLRQVGGPALWFVGLPYALIVGQRVFPPERVLLYKAFFFFILLALVLDWVLRQWPQQRRLRQSLTVLAVLFVSYGTYSVVRVNPAARGTNAAYHAGLQWLATQPRGPVLVPEPTHNLFFRFYAHSEMRHRPWRIDHDQLGNTRYHYVVAFPNKRGFFQPQFDFPPAYRNAEVEIYAVPKNYPLATKAWRH